MKIPPDAIIAPEKITKYLLLPRKQDDKSRLLARFGFSVDTPAVLEAAIRLHASEGEGFLDVTDVYGEHFTVIGKLAGPRGTLSIKSVWVRRFGETAVRFVTLYPAKET